MFSYALNMMDVQFPLSVDLLLTGGLGCQSSLSTGIQEIWIPKQAQYNHFKMHVNYMGVSKK